MTISLLNALTVLLLSTPSVQAPRAIADQADPQALGHWRPEVFDSRNQDEVLESGECWMSFTCEAYGPSGKFVGECSPEAREEMTARAAQACTDDSAEE